MRDLLAEAKKSIALFDGTLIVGNHDSITLLGTQSQAKLRDYSKAVSKHLLGDNDELDAAIANVISEIEKFEYHTKKKLHRLFGFGDRYREIRREYSKIIEYMERLCLFFQLQQAQLLKENKLLEKLSIYVRDSITSLDECIKVGQEVLICRPVPAENNYSSHPSSFLCVTEEDDNTWYSRLTRRLDDLSISHTVALQNQAQIKVLYDNNLVLLDRISGAITNTFPIWQSQMATMLGIESMKRRILEQNRLFGNAKTQSSSRRGYSGIPVKNRTVEIERIMTLNSTLKDALSETASLENQDQIIRKNIHEAVQHFERG